jgi:hypothetical protein
VVIVLVVALLVPVPLDQSDARLGSRGGAWRRRERDGAAANTAATISILISGLLSTARPAVGRPGAFPALRDCRNRGDTTAGMICVSPRRYPVMTGRLQVKQRRATPFETAPCLSARCGVTSPHPLA